MQADPVCTVVAGANGSGKSTIYPELHAVGEFVNGDVVARMLNPDNPGLVSLGAGRRVLQRWTRCSVTARASSTRRPWAAINRSI